MLQNEFYLSGGEFKLLTRTLFLLILDCSKHFCAMQSKCGNPDLHTHTRTHKPIPSPLWGRFKHNPKAFPFTAKKKINVAVVSRGTDSQLMRFVYCQSTFKALICDRWFAPTDRLPVYRETRVSRGGGCCCCCFTWLTVTLILWVLARRDWGNSAKWNPFDWMTESAATVAEYKHTMGARASIIVAWLGGGWLIDSGISEYCCATKIHVSKMYSVVNFTNVIIL